MELIGNGGHWAVSRITTTENGISKSIVFKKPLKNQKPDNNISNYRLIFSCNLPTLSKFSKTTINGIEGIEAEDLNPKNCDGFYVSPNTIRNSENCASIIIKYLKNSKETLPGDCKEFNVSEYIKHPEKIEEDIDKLIEKRILKGAEKYVYENKINTISNFNNFLIKSKADMKKASDNQIELFSDAFFFRVSQSTKGIEYKIADFDCIISHKKSKTSHQNLLNGNLSYFETALTEFIEFFVEKNHKETYITEIKNVW
ncbi:hypothetical protein KZY98_13230 [Croceibacter atlanticus]|nr:hypothetical protein [Croceibacter atlanticus]